MLDLSEPQEAEVQEHILYMKGSKPYEAARAAIKSPHHDNAVRLMGTGVPLDYEDAIEFFESPSVEKHQELQRFADGAVEVVNGLKQVLALCDDRATKDAISKAIIAAVASHKRREESADGYLEYLNG